MIQGRGSFVVFRKVQGRDHDMHDQDETHSSSPRSSNDSDATETNSRSGGEEAEESDEEVGQTDASSGSRSTGSDDEEEEDNGEEVEQSDASNGDEEGGDDREEVSDASCGDEEEEDNGEEVEQSDASSGDEEKEDSDDEVEQSDNGDEEGEDDGEEVSDASCGDEEEEDNGKEVEQSDASSGDEEKEDNGEEIERSDASHCDEEEEDDGEKVEQNEASSGDEAEEDDGEEVEQSDTSSGDKKEVVQSDASSGDEEGEYNGEEVEQSDVSSSDKEGKDDGKEVKHSDTSSGGEEEEDNGHEVEQNDTNSDGGSASDGCEEEEKYDEEEEYSNTNNGKKDKIRRDLARQVKGDDDLAFQLIDGASHFRDTALNDFANDVNLYECGRSYAVVAIMGPQSSGKSTLLNHLFQTKFTEMDETEGRSQTTQGIWMARCCDIKPLTLVMDIEGSDGSERGEDDTTFEKRSALFALAVADVVLVNLWCHDIGREQAASKPLLRVVFQQVLLRFSNKPRKITLMFVVRDKTRSPENKLEAKLRSDVEKIWTSIIKPTGNSNAPLSDFFKIEVVFLPNYEEKEKDFKLKVRELKQRFSDSNAPGGLADSGEGKEPASCFAISARNIWKDIMDNKDLNLPAHKIVVATTRCQQIINELLDGFETNEDWCNLRKKAFDGFFSDFGERVNSILNHFLSRFDEEACYYDEAITTEKRKELVDKLLKHVKPVHRAVLNNISLQHLKKFTEAFQKSSCGEDTFAKVANSCLGDALFKFDKHCEAIKVDLANWDTLKARTKLHKDMKSFLAKNGQQQSESVIVRLYEPQVKQDLSDSVRCLLCEEGDANWSKIRKRLNIVMQSTITKLNITLSNFGVEEEGRIEKIQNLEKHAKQIVEAVAREESGRAGYHMIEKFLMLFKRDRQWRSVEEIEAAAEAALYTPLDMLSGFAAIRLEAGDIDNIHEILSSEFRGSGNKNTQLLAAASWEQVPPSRTLLPPSQCMGLWRSYIIEAKDAVQNARKSIKKRKPRWMKIVLSTVEDFILKPIDWLISWF